MPRHAEQRMRGARARLGCPIAKVGKYRREQRAELGGDQRGGRWVRRRREHRPYEQLCRHVGATRRGRGRVRTGRGGGVGGPLGGAVFGPRAAAAARRHGRHSHVVRDVERRHLRLVSREKVAEALKGEARLALDTFNLVAERTEEQRQQARRMPPLLRQLRQQLR